MDKYDQAITRITERVAARSEGETESQVIEEVWRRTARYSEDFCLFVFAGRTPLEREYRPVMTGCLTEIRSDESCHALTPELTEAIRADERLPKSGEEIALADLPVFAEWQRRLDAAREVLG